MIKIDVKELREEIERAQTLWRDHHNKKEIRLKVLHKLDGIIEVIKVIDKHVTFSPLFGDPERDREWEKILKLLNIR